MLNRAAPLLGMVLVMLAACHAVLPTSANDVASDNWTSHNGNPHETSYSQLAQIDKSAVSRLGLAWFLDLPGEAGLEATPLAVDGVLYFTGSYAKVYAVNGVTGQILWTFDPKTWENNPQKMPTLFSNSRGVAYDNGRIFAAAFDGRLFALDAKTGKQLWSTQTVGPNTMQAVSGAPRTFNGKVIIGQGGADYGERGYVTAYDQATGKQVWRFYVVPGSPDQNKGDPAMEKAAATWRGTWWKTGTGGGPWDAITFDPELNRIYVGTANAAPYDVEARSPGGGDNLYTASIVALDADTGKYVWHYQVNPRDAWDFDSTQHIMLAELKIDGQQRRVLMQAPKNGFFYVLDRGTGKLISAEKIAKATWADHIDLATGRPVEARNIRLESGETTIWPTISGAHSWQAMAFSPETGLVYVPTMQAGQHISRKPTGLPGEITAANVSSANVVKDPLDGKGALVAWDPVTAKPAWRVQQDTIWNGGVLATAGGLVFQGAGDGYLHAFDAKTGGELWKFNAHMGIIAAPMAWSAGGKQYISVLAGYGGIASSSSDLMNAGWKFSQPRRLLTFALDAKSALPDSPGPDKAIHPVDDPAIKLNPADVATGRSLYLACMVCHGRDAVSAGGPAPDLRESQIALDKDSLYAAVHDGALIQQGMPKFPMFNRQQVTQIWAYLRQRARDASAAPPARAPGR